MNHSTAGDCQPLSLPLLDAEGRARVQIVLGRGSLDLSAWRRGATAPQVELDTAADGDVEVLVDGNLVARGAAMVLDGKIAVRISELVDGKAAPSSTPHPQLGAGH